MLPDQLLNSIKLFYHFQYLVIISQKLQSLLKRSDSPGFIANPPIAVRPAAVYVRQCLTAILLINNILAISGEFLIHPPYIPITPQNAIKAELYLFWQ